MHADVTTRVLSISHRIPDLPQSLHQVILAHSDANIVRIDDAFPLPVVVLGVLVAANPQRLLGRDGGIAQLGLHGAVHSRIAPLPTASADLDLDLGDLPLPCAW